jgi:uncharacterized membrane protein
MNLQNVIQKLGFVGGLVAVVIAALITSVLVEKPFFDNAQKVVNGSTLAFMITYLGVAATMFKMKHGVLAATTDANGF